MYYVDVTPIHETTNEIENLPKISQYCQYLIPGFMS